MLAIPKVKLPANETTIRASLGKYKAELAAHKKTVGVPAPWPDFEILREIVANGEEFSVIEQKEPSEDLPTTLEEWKALASKRVNADRERALSAGVTYGGSVYDSDNRSRANLTGAVAATQAGIPLPDRFTWRTSDNKDVPMTAVELVGLAAAMLSHVNAQYRRSWELKAQINAATTAEEVAAVKWSG